MQFIYRSIFIFVVCNINILFGSKVIIIYTANINATYENCACGSNPLGGIDRLQTYIDDFRLNNPNSLVIDGGNFFNSYPFIELNNKALESLSILKYDLLAVGVHLFSENKSLYNQLSIKYKDNIICSNSNLNLNKYKDLIIDNTKVRIFSYISPDLFKYSTQPEWLTLHRDLEHEKYIKDGINILVYNGQLQTAQNFLKQNRVIV